MNDTRNRIDIEKNGTGIDNENGTKNGMNNEMKRTETDHGTGNENDAANKIHNEMAPELEMRLKGEMEQKQNNWHWN